MQPMSRLVAGSIMQRSSDLSRKTGDNNKK
jgi:hypothetical protein